MITLYWKDADTTASIFMGEYATPADAIEAMDICNDELLDVCFEEKEAAVIRAGSWSVESDEPLLMNTHTGTVQAQSHWESDGFTSENSDLKEVKWYGDYWVEV